MTEESEEDSNHWAAVSLWEYFHRFLILLLKSGEVSSDSVYETQKNLLLENKACYYFMWIHNKTVVDLEGEMIRKLLPCFRSSFI